MVRHNDEIDDIEILSGVFRDDVIVEYTNKEIEWQMVRNRFVKQK